MYGGQLDTIDSTQRNFTPNTVHPTDIHFTPVVKARDHDNLEI